MQRNTVIKSVECLQPEFVCVPGAYFEFKLLLSGSKSVHIISTLLDKVSNNTRSIFVSVFQYIIAIYRNYQ